MRPTAATRTHPHGNAKGIVSENATAAGRSTIALAICRLGQRPSTGLTAQVGSTPPMQPAAGSGPRTNGGGLTGGYASDSRSFDRAAAIVYPNLEF